MPARAGATAARARAGKTVTTANRTARRGPAVAIARNFMVACFPTAHSTLRFANSRQPIAAPLTTTIMAQIPNNPQ
ncbi:MAG: hypothetical protein QF582_18035 [Alphaproteobacteria bacterium]|nr:hypothetical protein [Alphaproteobacteria bacterium]